MAKICIDPGHGGRDPGGGSNSHFKEKDMVLAISLEQKRHFERNGVSVSMTRTRDVYLGPTERTNKVKASGAKYCLSNHINAHTPAAKGAETIHSIYANKRIAQGVLDALVAEGAHYRRVFSKKGKSGDWYYMLRQTGSVQTVICEYGFATNKEDTDKILKNWKVYAEVVARYYIEKVFKKKYISEKGSPKASKPAINPTSGELYRVRKSWADSAGQKGAYKVLRNAQATADRHKMNVYDSKGKSVYQSSAPVKRPASKPKAASRPKARLQVDGKWGPATTRALQRYYGTPVDGILSKPSLVIRRLQATLGTKVDGYFGPNSIRAMQRRFGTGVDGIISKPVSAVVKALQRRLNQGKL